MRGLALALGVWGALAAAGCASGVSCTDKSGICNPGADCPSGYQVVSNAQYTAAGQGSYGCPSNQGGNDAGNTSAPTCCVPIPASN